MATSAPRWQCAVCTEIQPLDTSKEEALCRDCGAPGSVEIGGGALAHETGVNLSLVRVILGKWAVQAAQWGSGGTSGDGHDFPAAGAAFLASYGLDSEAALGAVVRGDGCALLTAHSPPVRAAASAAPRPAGLSFGPPSTPLVGVVYDGRMLLHECAQGACGGPVERPDRLAAAVGVLAGLGLLQACARIAAREATDAEVAGVTSAAHRERLAAAAAAGAALPPGESAYLGAARDTYWGRGTALAARLALGCVAEAVACASRGVVDRAMCLVRPPGHHATADASRGFCVLNNVAGAVRAALAADAALVRVLIVDLDVHHGDGTQALFEADPRVLTFSCHRYDGGEYYPSTGHAHATGEGAGAGFACNVGLDGSWHGDAELAAVTDALLAPLARAFAPQLVVVALGCDSARGDALGDWDVTPAGYGYVLHALAGIGTPLVVATEGGYNCEAVAGVAAAVARVLLGGAPPPLVQGEVGAGALAEAALLGGGDGGCFYGCAGSGEPAEVQAAAAADRAHCGGTMQAGHAWRRAAEDAAAEDAAASAVSITAVEAAWSAGGAVGASPVPAEEALPLSLPRLPLPAHPQRARGPRPAALSAIRATRRALAPYWAFAREEL